MMTHLYRISYHAFGAGRRVVRTKQQVADDLYQAIDRITNRVKCINPRAKIDVKGALVFNRNTQEWERITFMGLKLTTYQIAEFLKSEGFGVSSSPFDTAIQGGRVLIFAPTKNAAAHCQRSYYKRLSDTKTDFTAKNLTFRFKNGGRIEIHTPDVNLNSFRGLNRETTFYSLFVF